MRRLRGRRASKPRVWHEPSEAVCPSGFPTRAHVHERAISWCSSAQLFLDITVSFMARPRDPCAVPYKCLCGIDRAVIWT